MSTPFRSGQTLLFIGDSITDAGRRERDQPLGGGYVRAFSDLLGLREPAKRVRILNRGIGGNTVDDLRSRWADHVLAHAPDWIVIKIGFNDLNRHLCAPDSTPLQSPASFAEIYDQVLALTRERLPDAGLLLVSPFFASTDATPRSYRARVLERVPVYVEIVRSLAARHGARFLDLHAAVQELLRELPAESFAEDAVHPGSTGALFIAERVHAALQTA